MPVLIFFSTPIKYLINFGVVVHICVCQFVKTGKKNSQYGSHSLVNNFFSNAGLAMNPPAQTQVMNYMENGREINADCCYSGFPNKPHNLAAA